MASAASWARAESGCVAGTFVPYLYSKSAARALLMLNVVTARATLLPGALVADGVTATQRIPPGHKVALRATKQGEPILKYNQIIGFATQPIAPGEHVHVHNMGMGDFDKDYAYGVDAK